MFRGGSRFLDCVLFVNVEVGRVCGGLGCGTEHISSPVVTVCVVGCRVQVGVTPVPTHRGSDSDEANLSSVAVAPLGVGTLMALSGAW